VLQDCLKPSIEQSDSEATWISTRLPQSPAQGKHSDEKRMECYCIFPSRAQESVPQVQDFLENSRGKAVFNLTCSTEGLGVAAEQPHKFWKQMAHFEGQGIDRVRKCETPNCSYQRDVPEVLFSSDKPCNLRWFSTSLQGGSHEPKYKTDNLKVCRWV